MKSFIKKLVPEFILDLYHKSLALVGAFIYGRPSNKLIVIGVTGTNGKSTVVNLIGYILEEAGHKVGWTSTINFKVADKIWLNDQKMTMPGRFAIQKLLKQMLKKNCSHAIIETSSEGIKQHRHLGINYDIAVFTNLTPEHLETHGSFENYKQAKAKLFKHLTHKPKKNIKGKIIDKTIIINNDDEFGSFFLDFKADQKLTFSINKEADFKAEDIKLTSSGTFFKIEESTYKNNLLGKVNIYNCLAAIAIANTQKIKEEIIKQALIKYQVLSGRYEFIDQGQNFKVMVDYAPEPESMKNLYETLNLFKFNHIIHVLGSCGGGRDHARRPVLGALAASKADYVIVTNEDPYNDDPQLIINEVAQGAIKAGKVLNHNLFKIMDRKEAISYALSLAQKNDLVLLTGKGAEQFICVADNKKIPWDDREIVKELLK
ncbi:UDP-N-acetylmuramoyl-L-alanyl-D-glutamate--2,6-diaminopimelate ligase [Patescibacteria group bacterium]|nr:UDP-N-acetylmuramoyl-L-alanyl-D-glutamate--2,6-diaminopimelate ligase [Patescibacteria group bacterium]